MAFQYHYLTIGWLMSRRTRLTEVPNDKAFTGRVSLLISNNRPGTVVFPKPKEVIR
jgi:hypothetical protein